MPTPHPDSPPRDLIEQQIYRIFRNMAMAGFDPPNPKEIEQMLTQFEAPSVMSGVKPVRQTQEQRETMQRSALQQLVGMPMSSPITQGKPMAPLQGMQPPQIPTGLRMQPPQQAGPMQLARSPRRLTQQGAY